MKPSTALDAHREAVRRIVQLHHVRNPRVFGSVLHHTDDASSDLDLLVDPLPETTLMDIGALRAALQQQLGVRVDVLTPGALPDKFRDQILSSATAV